MAAIDKLQGWKEIASWLGRDERTAKRWEKQRGLPVRRVPGTGRANVFCLVPELEAWLISTTTAEPQPVQPQPAQPQPTAIALPPNPPPPASPSEALAPPAALAPLPTPERIPELIPEPTLPEPPPTAQPAATQPSPLHTRRRLTLPIAATLLLALSILPATRLLHPAPPAPVVHVAPAQARELALQASFLFEQRNPDSLARARAAYEAALRLDPSFAEAHAGLAQTFLLLREYSDMPQQEAYGRAEQAAHRALALNPNLADAQTALGFVDFFFHWQPVAAEARFRSAIALDPRSALAHHWFGSMLLHQARFDEAVQELNSARALQPGSPAILATTALALGLGGHRQAALELARSTLSYQPENAPMHRTLAVLSLTGQRDIPTYLAELRRFATIAHDPVTLATLDVGEPAFRTGGEPALWQAMLQHQQALSPHPTVRCASLQAAAGHPAAALDELSTLAGRRDPDMIGIAIDPLLQDLRLSGQLRPIASRMNLTLAADRQLLARSDAAPLSFPTLP